MEGNWGGGDSESGSTEEAKMQILVSSAKDAVGFPNGQPAEPRLFMVSQQEGEGWRKDESGCTEMNRY